MSDSEEVAPKFDIPWKWITIIFGGLLFIWLSIGFLPVFAQHGWSLTFGTEHAGEFGDSFGFINSLFSGMALAGVIVAIILQCRELRAQQHELSLTSKALARSAEAQEQTQRTMLITAYLQAAAQELELADQEMSIAGSQFTDGIKEKWRRDVTRLHAHALLRHLLNGDLPASIAIGTIREMHFGVLDSFEWFVAKLRRTSDGHELKSLASQFRERLRNVRNSTPIHSASPALVADMIESLRELSAYLDDRHNQPSSTTTIASGDAVDLRSKLRAIAERLAKHFGEESLFVSESIEIMNQKDTV
jgi:hypothetical protein